MAEAKKARHANISWPLDGGMAQFANNVVLQQEADGVYYLSFYQVNPPVMLGGEAEKEQESQCEIVIQAIPVARIAMTKEKFRSLFELLERHAEEMD